MTAPARRFAVLQVIDALDTGGAERIAVSIANELARRGHRSFLCMTRREGPLAAELDPAVHRLVLGRKSRLDVAAIRKLVSFVDKHEIELVHAHGTSLFVCALASLLGWRARLVWHDHNGLGSLPDNRSPLAYRLLTSRLDAAIAVSEPIAAWARDVARVPPSRVHYVPNFILPQRGVAHVDVPGVSGGRIVCVANLRAPKDHVTLLAAMRIVVARRPAAHLLLVGAESDPRHAAEVRAEIAAGLEGCVTLLGQRFDVSAILAQCDVGVSSSRAEGMPLAVLEYGAARLAVVASDVGQCSEVLDHGQAGVLVAAGDPVALGEALVALLVDGERRARLGAALQIRVRDRYDLRTGVDHILAVYRAIA